MKQSRNKDFHVHTSRIIQKAIVLLFRESRSKFLERLINDTCVVLLYLQKRCSILSITHYHTFICEMNHWITGGFVVVFSTSKFKFMGLNQKRWWLGESSRILSSFPTCILGVLGSVFMREGRMEHELDRQTLCRGKGGGELNRQSYVPSLTYGHELWFVTQRTRSWYKRPKWVSSTGWWWWWWGGAPLKE